MEVDLTTSKNSCCSLEQFFVSKFCGPPESIISLDVLLQIPDEQWFWLQSVCRSSAFSRIKCLVVNKAQDGAGLRRFGLACAISVGVYFFQQIIEISLLS